MGKTVIDLTGNTVVADGFVPSVQVEFDGDASDIELASPVLGETDVQAALEALADLPYTWADQGDYTETESIATVADALNVILATLASEFTPV